MSFFDVIFRSFISSVCFVMLIKVKHYLKSSSGISCHLDIDDSGWKYAFANLSEKELASCSLAQVIAQFTPCLDKIQKIVLRSFSALAVMVSSVEFNLSNMLGFSVGIV